MYCSNCGRQLNDDERFCSGCGNMVAGGQSGSHGAPSKNNRTVIIALCAVIAVLVIGIVAVFASDFADELKGKNEETTTTETTTKKAADESTTKETTTESTTKVTTTAGQAVTKKGETAQTNVASKPTDADGIVAPDFYTSEGYFYVEPEEGLFIRKGPGRDYDEITLLDQGVCVQYKGKRSDSPGWYYVSVVSSSIVGWVSTDYLTTKYVDSSMINRYYKYTNTFSARVTEREGLNLRSGASTSSSVIDVIPYDKTVTVLGYSAYDSDWLCVTLYLNGRTCTGFVSGRYLSW